MRDVLLEITCNAVVGSRLSACLITNTDSSEYADLLMTKSFAAVNAGSPQVAEQLRVEQQSTQAEVIAETSTLVVF